MAETTETTHNGRPQDAAALAAAIREAAAKLGTGGFTQAGQPKVAALEKALGYNLSRDEVDAAMATASPNAPEPPAVPGQRRDPLELGGLEFELYRALMNFKGDGGFVKEGDPVALTEEDHAKLYAAGLVSKAPIKH